MPRKSVKSEILSFVALGSFNPQIFHPAWLLKEGIISPKDADAIEVKINSRNISVLSNSWLGVEARDLILKVTVNQKAYYEIVRDIVGGIFQVLNNTPVRALGINNSANVSFEKQSDRVNVGAGFINLDNWESLLKDPQFNQIVVQGTKKSDKYKGYQRITIQPSIEIEGIFIDVNDHFELDSDPQFEVVWTDKDGIKYVKGENISKILFDNFKTSIDGNLETLSSVIERL